MIYSRCCKAPMEVCSGETQYYYCVKCGLAGDPLVILNEEFRSNKEDMH